jgi:predicted small secreted protein
MAHRSATGVVLAMVVVALAATGCNTTGGKPVAANSPAVHSSAATTAPSAPTSPSSTSSKTPAAAPTGPPVGTATMQVSGAAGPVTIKYQINGGPEQTETNVTLPWEKQYPVYNQIESSVTADAGDTELSCNIIMDGKLVALKSEPRPTCSFAYFD